MTTMRKLALFLLPPFSLAGCNVDVMQPRGEGAASIAELIWIFTVLSAAIWLLVVGVLLVALARRRVHVRFEPLPEQPAGERVATRTVGACVVLTGIIVAALTFLSYMTGKSLADLGDHAGLTVEIKAQQWWWEVTYDDPAPSKILTTADEIHIPVGRPVRFRLTSTDVIHSFWVPRLAGKQDLIPNQTNEITIRAAKPGVYRAPCAEYCGLQHAHMATYVVAQPVDEFESWRDAQLKPAAQPGDPEAQRGELVFATRGCAMCHAIRGTSAGGHVAPDLTHIASRRTIAAGTLPMSRGSLAAWIRNPQGIKPGSNMPEVDLSPDELNAVVAYLVTLK